MMPAEVKIASNAASGMLKGCSSRGIASTPLMARKEIIAIANEMTTARRAAFLPKYSLSKSVIRNVSGKRISPQV